MNNSNDYRYRESSNPRRTFSIIFRVPVHHRIGTRLIRAYMEIHLKSGFSNVGCVLDSVVSWIRGLIGISDKQGPIRMNGEIRCFIIYY